MKDNGRAVVEMPANPFIAFADFLFVLLMILVVVAVQQSIVGTQMIQRLAVGDKQETLKREFQTGALASAFSDRRIRESYVDGDLQRFWLDSSMMFGPGEYKVGSEKGLRLIAEVGRVLAKAQGNPKALGTGSFKRIIVEGHAAAGEGDEMGRWSLSLQRALSVTEILQKVSGIHPSKIEISGRGSYSLDARPKIDWHMSPSQLAAYDRRVDIVIVYSGQMAADQ